MRRKPCRAMVPCSSRDRACVVLTRRSRERSNAACSSARTRYELPVVHASKICTRASGPVHTLIYTAGLHLLCGSQFGPGVVNVHSQDTYLHTYNNCAPHSCSNTMWSAAGSTHCIKPAVHDNP